MIVTMIMFVYMFVYIFVSSSLIIYLVIFDHVCLHFLFVNFAFTFYGNLQIHTYVTSSFIQQRLNVIPIVLLFTWKQKFCYKSRHFLMCSPNYKSNLKKLLQIPQYLLPFRLLSPPFFPSAIVCLFACLFVSKEAFVVSVLPQPLHLVLLRLLPFL